MSDKLQISRGLEKVSSNEMPQMPQLSSKIILANRNYPKVRSYSIEELSKLVRPLINRTILESGINMHEDDIKFLIPSVINDLHDLYPNLTLKEFELICRLGVRGKMGEAFGMTVRTFNLWCDHYITVVKIQAERDYKKAVISMPKARNEISQSEKDAIFNEWMETVMKGYDTLRNGGPYKIVDYNNQLYNFLEQLRLIDLSIDEKKEYLADAKNKYIQDFIHNPRRKRGGGRHVSVFMGELEDSSNEENPKHTASIKMIAKGLALRDFLMQQALEQVDLNEIIKRNLSNGERPH